MKKPKYEIGQVVKHKGDKYKIVNRVYWDEEMARKWQEDEPFRDYECLPLDPDTEFISEEELDEEN